jgi:hypothetical protein
MLARISAYTTYIQLGLFLVLAGFALRRGAGPERASAAAFFLMYLLDYPYHWLFEEARWGQVDMGHALIDGVAAALMILTAVWANRIYTLFLAAFQLLSLSSHFARGLENDVHGLAYAVMIIWPSYLVIATIAIGLVFHRRRVRDYGNYRSWRHEAPAWLSTGMLA